MKKKIVNHFTYTGLGFPIELSQVEMVKIHGEWHPKIDVRKVAKTTIKTLAFQKERLTGAQVKFIRSYFSMTLRDFANEVVHESHTAVSKWEKFGNKATNMDINIEVMLRLYILEQVDTNTARKKSEFFKKYREVKQRIFSPDNHESHSIAAT